MKPFLKIFVLLLLTAWPCLSGVAIPTSPVTASLSVSAGSLASFSVQVRMHGQNWSILTGGPLFSVGGYGIQPGGGNQVYFTSPEGSTSNPTQGNCNFALPGGVTDFTFAVNRDLSAAGYSSGVVRADAFATTTGALIGSCFYAIATPSTGSTITGAGISIGTSGATGYIDFIRWQPSAVPYGAAVPASVASPASLLDLEFPSSLTGNDTSGHAQNLSGLTYQASPTYAPVCNAGNIQTVAVGSSMTLNGGNSYSLNGNASLTYAWSYLGTGADGVTQTPSYTSTSVVNPTVNGLVFGSFNSQLIVTDSSSVSTTCAVHNGAVPITAGKVDLSAEHLTASQQFIIGPQVMYGANPWPFADTATLSELNLQVSQLKPGGFYDPYWRNLATGTITLTGGNSTVVGSGTSFITLFCGGSGSTPISGAQLIWKYTGTDSRTHYTYAAVTSCTDDTHLVMASPYPTSPHAPWRACSSGCAGLQYAEVASSVSVAWNNWFYGPAPGNYYDNLMSFLVGYWRSGSDAFYSAAQTMATYWMEWPFLDSFYNCDPTGNNLNPGGGACWGDTRQYALTGIALWEQQSGNSYLLPSIEGVANYFLSYAGTLPYPQGIADMRSDAYAFSGLAVASMVETDGTKKASYQAALKHGLDTLWTPFRASSPFAGWYQLYYSIASLSSVAGTANGCSSTCSVSVTNGSATVTGTGTPFSSTMLGASLWIFPSPAGALPAFGTGDTSSYVVTAVSGQTLTLATPYAGTTAGTAGFLATTNNAASGLVGYGFQPFMEGHLAQMFFFASQAMTGYSDAFVGTGNAKATFLGYGHDAVNLIARSIPPDNGGLYYGAYFPGCTPPMLKSATWTGLYCYGTSDSPNAFYTGTPATISPEPGVPAENRLLATEVMRAFALDFQNFGTNAATGNLLMSQLFSKAGSGGPNSDGFYLSDYDIAHDPPLAYYLTQDTKAKWAGELGGYTGAAWAWPGVLSPHGMRVIGGRVRSGGRTH